MKRLFPVLNWTSPVRPVQMNEQSHVVWHSENMVVAFGLFSMPEGVPIHIVNMI